MTSGEYASATGVAIVSVFAAMVTMLFQYKEIGTSIIFYFHFPFAG